MTLNRSNLWRSLMAGAAAVLLGACAQNAPSSSAAAGGSEVLTYGMGQQLQNYSALDQINRSTVKNLVPVWNLSLDNSANMSTQPLVKDGVMYVVTHNSTAAIDAVSGRRCGRPRSICRPTWAR